MNTAATLQGLVTTLEEQNKTKQDMIVPAGRLLVTGTGLIQVTDGHHLMEFSATNICHEQIAGKLKIPVQYYRRMLQDQKELLASNVNTWLKQEEKANYMLRTFATGDIGTARAFLSDRYHCLDNYDVLFAALDAIKQMGVKVEITKAEVTDRRMYLHVVCPDIEQQAEAFLKEYLKDNSAAGNGIMSGFVISNSEVGQGQFEIRPRAVICKCDNGLVVKDDKFSRIHLGGQLEEGFINWSKDTKQKNYELIISQTKDAVQTFLSKEYLGTMIEKIAVLHEIKLDHPMDCVTRVCKELNVTEEHKAGIMDFFLRDGDHMASGVFQAVTRQAQKMGADDQFEIEANITGLMMNIKGFDKPFSKS